MAHVSVTGSGQALSVGSDKASPWPNATWIVSPEDGGGWTLNRHRGMNYHVGKEGCPRPIPSTTCVHNRSVNYTRVVKTEVTLVTGERNIDVKYVETKRFI